MTGLYFNMTIDHGFKFRNQALRINI